MSAAPSLRLGRAADAGALARLQRKVEPESFTSLLGPGFLRAYYARMLAEPRGLVVCAVDGDGAVVGAATGSLDAAEHLRELRRGRLALLAGALPTLVTHPRLLPRLAERQRSAASGAEEYVVAHGARMENWMWDPARPDPVGPVRLIRAWLEIARGLGAAEILCEVDDDLPKVARLHRALGASVFREFATPDGRKRQILRYAGASGAGAAEARSGAAAGPAPR